MELQNSLSKVNSASSLLLWKEIRLPEIMFCLSVISVFLPFKVYPLFFLMSSIVFILESYKPTLQNWMIFLSIFTLYATISYLVTYNGDPLLRTNILKLLVNFLFLYCSILWLRERENGRLLVMVDYAFHLVFLLALIQLLVYHHAMDYKLIYGSSSSGQASSLYRKDLFFWGLDDKNMFGARIALLGFIYILIPLVRTNQIAFFRIILVFALAYLSVSRTPIVALLIGCGLLFWFSSNKIWRILLLALIGLASPFILQKVIRVEQLTASNDGMGIRLVYWKAFFQNFASISPLGNGFMAAPEFLKKYADFYRGESHIHNTFMSTYLEFGIIGFMSYSLFLINYIWECLRKFKNPKFWILSFSPIFSIMLILYSGYDNDIILYLILLFLLGTFREINFNTIKTRILPWEKKC